MITAHSFTFGYFLTKYKTKFDKIDIKNILNSLIKKGYITEKAHKYYGIPNVGKFKEIEGIFKFRNCIDRIKHFLFQILKFILKIIFFIFHR